MAFKIATLAKDLGIKSKEITELLTARGVECKTTQKSLSEAEFDLVFETLTRASQITGIDDYLFGDTYIPTASAEKKESKKPKAEKAEKAENEVIVKAEAPAAAPAEKKESPAKEAPAKEAAP